MFVSFLEPQSSQLKTSNPTPIVIPCHRVVNSRGMLAKAFVFGGEGVQESFLKADGVSVENGAVDLVKHGWFFEKK